MLAVVNVSEGRRAAVLRDLVEAAGPCLLDLHHDAHHHRAVLTLGHVDGSQVEAAARYLTVAAVDAIDLREHGGVHPRFGVVDVVPFVPLIAGHPAGVDDDLGAARLARDRFADWAATELDLPCFRYGPERSLPEVRRRAFVDLGPDVGPDQPHPTAGACAVGARPALVAYNLWLEAPLATARRIAGAVRSPAVRALGLAVGAHTQVSCNLVDPYRVGPADVHDAVVALAEEDGAQVVRAELVGLVPQAVADAIAEEDRSRLDVTADRTVEHRLGLHQVA